MPLLQQLIDSEHFTELIAYEQIEPRGEWRADLRSAIIASTLVNVHRGKNSPVAKVKDFMPQFGKPAKKSPEEMMATAKAITAAMKANAKTIQPKARK